MLKVYSSLSLAIRHSRQHIFILFDSIRRDSLVNLDFYVCCMHIQIGREKICRDGNDYGEVKCARVSWRAEKVNGVYDAAREIRAPFAKRS